MDWLFDLIMDWLGGKTVWVPTPIFLLYIVPITQALKKIFEALQDYEWFQGWAHGKGPIYMNALISALTVLISCMGEGSPLTGAGLIQVVLAFVTQAGLLTVGGHFFYNFLRDKVFTKE